MIVAGIGLRKDATLDSLKSAFEATGVMRVDAVATPEDKASHPAFQALAKELRVALIEVPVSELTAQETATQSAKVIEMRGTGSVAEAAALAAAGDGGQLTVERKVSGDRMATCAIAEGSAQ